MASVDPTLGPLIREAAAQLRRLLEVEAQETPLLPWQRPPAVPIAVTAPGAIPPSHRSAAVPRRPGDPLPLLHPHEAAGLAEDLPSLERQVQQCTRCDLHRSRTHAVFGEGPTDRPRILFVGEGPGQEEDRTGRPFVGPAGQLLDRMILAMGLTRDQCYIANVVKCRPPGNATPLPDQRGACRPYLMRQIEILRPRLIIALGAVAADVLLGRPDAVARLRAKVHRLGGIPLVVTYHPAAMLRNPEYKKPAWEDLKLAMRQWTEPGSRD